VDDKELRDASSSLKDLGGFLSGDGTAPSRLSGDGTAPSRLSGDGTAPSRLSGVGTASSGLLSGAGTAGGLKLSEEKASTKQPEQRFENYFSVISSNFVV
jgi:hypothetical protein